MYKNLTKEEVEELREKWEKEYQNGLYGHNDFEIADWWLSQIDQLIGKRMEEEALEKAEQQILGFYHCYNGHDIGSLVEAMGLAKDEFDLMCKKGMLNYLPEELGNEIVESLTNKE